MTSFYDPETGSVYPATYSGPDVEGNTPAGYVAVEGDLDYQRHRFDPASGAVVDLEHEPHSREVLWRRVRAMRDRRLRDTDWIVTRAAERGEPIPPAWKDYRQALRDITMQPDPLFIQWPEAPK